MVPHEQGCGGEKGERQGQGEHTQEGREENKYKNRE